MLRICSCLRFVTCANKHQDAIRILHIFFTMDESEQKSGIDWTEATKLHFVSLVAKHCSYIKNNATPLAAKWSSGHF
jgi:hypothetical protein